MKKMMTGAPAVLALPLAACGGNGEGKLAKQIEKAADNRVDAMEADAQALKEAAKEERETGKDRGDAIRAADVNAAAMSPEQRGVVVANEAAAVL